MDELLDKRLLFVTGKGGVGKTTVTAALGLAAAQRGKRVVMCEVARSERLAPAFGRTSIGFSEPELEPGLHAISIDPHAALEEYLSDQLGVVAGRLLDNRLLQQFAAATPGLSEMVTIGKVWELAQAERRTPGAATYDLVVVDTPASGHAIALLAAPRTFRDVARAGPVRRQAALIAALVADGARTGVVAVSSPEEMAVTETLELRARLRDELRMTVDTVVVNGLWPRRFDGGDVERMEQAAATANGSPPPAVLADLRGALAEHRRATLQREQLDRLEGALAEDGSRGRKDERATGTSTIVTLPFLFDFALGRTSVARLSDALARGG